MSKLKRVLIIIMILIAISLSLYLHINKNTGYVRCVQVEYKNDFTGKFLKNNNAVYNKVTLIEFCLDLDERVDGKDGHKSGLVRWARCLNGPDCDEAGDF